MRTRYALLIGTLALLAHPGMAWASGKICSPGMRCEWLFRGAIATLFIGALCVVLLAISGSQVTRRLAILFGVINLVMGERFWSRPTYDIFFNNSILSLSQMAVGVLCLALAFLQAKRAAQAGQRQT